MTGAALVLLGPAGLDRVVAATDGIAAAAEDLQFDLGVGPGVDAARDGPVLIPDLTALTARWPVFAPGGTGLGVAAVFALPMRVEGVTIGVLDLYRDTSGGLINGLLPEAVAWAGAAAKVLAGPAGPGAAADRAAPGADRGRRRPG